MSNLNTIDQYFDNFEKRGESISLPGEIIPEAQKQSICDDEITGFYLYCREALEELEESLQSSALALGQKKHYLGVDVPFKPSKSSAVADAAARHTARAAGVLLARSADIAVPAGKRRAIKLAISPLARRELKYAFAHRHRTLKVTLWAWVARGNGIVARRVSGKLRLVSRKAARKHRAR